jgi:hypothetical protein
LDESEQLMKVIIIISLLMPPLLGHRPSLWITYKENGPQPTTRAQCGLMKVEEAKDVCMDRNWKELIYVYHYGKRA